MAESVVWGGVSNVVSQLANPLLQEAASLVGVRDQIEWVKTELQTLQRFLKGADSSRERGDEEMESWISGLRGVAYEMEDVIDTINYMRERRHQSRGFMGSISRYSHKPRELITLHKISSRINQIKIKIQNISERKDRYGIANLGESSAPVDESWQSLRQSSPHSDDDDIDVIGFEKDKKQLVSQLLDQNEKTRCVISIVGMGGLGKTTLARKVYNDPAIREHFIAFAWISVSQSYRVFELVKDITKKAMGIKKKEETTTGITEEDLEQMGEEEVREMLRDFLRDKKYLVVMDDVWTVDVWRKMQRFFHDENNGSRILLTTRQMEVANRAEPCFPPHQLHTLNDEESFQLLRRKAFPRKQDHVPTEFVELTEKLAKKCGGLPLALVVLGGLLLGRGRNYDAWCSVAKSINWESSGDGQECLNILGLSYEDLKYKLKPCFLYIAMFPEDFTISASKLVRLWIAEGFIPQEQTSTMEETARDWLDELVQRCMIQVVNRSEANGRVNSVRIHDMLRDFGLSEAKKDGFLYVCSSDDMVIAEGIPNHRAAFHSRINDRIVDSLHLRTLLGFQLVLKDSTAAGRFLNGLNLLRVLDLEGARDLKKLPKQIGNMIHLRYLGLRNTGLKRLPSSIGRLLNLQTLDVKGTDILWLPKSFWKIRTLRHLYINIPMFLNAPIIGAHQNLQTLQIWDIYCDKSDMVRLLGIRFIKKWVTIPGFTKNTVSKIHEITFVESLEKAFEKMDNLISLALKFDGIPRDVLFVRAPNLYHLRSLALVGHILLKPQLLPDSSQFPPSLTKLILQFSRLDQDLMLVLEKLPNLRLLMLHMSAYVGESMSYSAGGFPRLQHLILSRLRDLEEWRVEVGAMPNLTHLTIDDCFNMKIVPEGLQHVTTLRELELRRMPREFHNRVINEDEYKVQHIPHHIPTTIYIKELQ